MKIVFIHPDLGIGGAERLVCDAAVALQHKAHEVSIVTAHHDIDHCFAETANGTLDVTVAGDWLPRSIFGKFYALCAYIRMIYIAVYVCVFAYNKERIWRADVVFCDQVSVCVPFFRLLSASKVLFYCHFPDQLLSTRTSWLKQWYRAPLDIAEEASTGCAHQIFVNSRFTESIFRQTFKRLANVPVTVLHPALNEHQFTSDGAAVELPQSLQLSAKCVFLSINRYERKKNIDLAVRALAVLQDHVSEEIWNDVHLVVAGGYDKRVLENVNYHDELQCLVDNLNLRDHVTFLKSCSNSQKRALLERCRALLYTPENEHFGIVPIEAMFCKRPVIAPDSGGPKETIRNNQTGFLVPPESECFATCMQILLENERRAEEMGEAGRAWVLNHFSFAKFADKLNSEVLKLNESVRVAEKTE